MTETPAAFLVAAALAGLASGGRRGVILGGLAFGLAGLCRPSLLAGAALTILAGLFAPPGRLEGAAPPVGLADHDDRCRPHALDDPQSHRPGRPDLDDDARRLHPGPGQQPRVLPRGPRRASRPGLDRRGPVAVVGLGESGDGRHDRAPGRPLPPGGGPATGDAAHRAISFAPRWPASAISGAWPRPPRCIPRSPDTPRWPGPSPCGRPSCSDWRIERPGPGRGSRPPWSSSA